MTFYPLPSFSSTSLSGSVLVIPSVSLGNLPQLAIDLLIATLALPRVGFVGRAETVAPFAGRGDGGEIVTGGMELYGQNGLFVIQQRSPTLKSKKDQHVALVREFVETFKFDFVLVLSSLDAANQDDAQLLTPHQHIIPPSSSSHPILTRLTQLPPLALHLDPSSAPFLPPSSRLPYPPFLPSAGLTRRLLAALNSYSSSSSSVPPHGAITAWCVEGDNRGDAHALASVVLAVIGKIPASEEQEVVLKEPTSWRGLFGPSDGWSGGSGADAEIYG